LVRYRGKDLSTVAELEGYARHDASAYLARWQQGACVCAGRIIAIGRAIAVVIDAVVADLGRGPDRADACTPVSIELARGTFAGLLAPRASANTRVGRIGHEAGLSLPALAWASFWVAAVAGAPLSGLHLAVEGDVRIGARQHGAAATPTAYARRGLAVRNRFLAAASSDEAQDPCGYDRDGK